ncbi:MarR family winged helix-turn-helix transcriptional regulator [Mesorhizobium sp.]|uniref:MarR family winged helix-turn-helix transcriptional regulator n=1 Tax=Mesorhizobium sp. TaxID=1871066 RepID=UPI002583531C|nr:MarR family winged helix-turn-helix transcriptional regulator [Mesorhizobium sp.]
MEKGDLTSDQRETIRRLNSALRPVRDQLNLAHLASLLTIAAEPGLSVNDLAERVAVPQPSASRFVSVLIGRYQSSDGVPPIPLIAQEVSTDDPRRRALFLNAHGHEVVQAILRAFEQPDKLGEAK